MFAKSRLKTARGGQNEDEEAEGYPDGYFPFEESPSRTPPKVRRPPYAQADVDCPGVETTAAGGGQQVQTLDNLCGDLNKGYIPKSPLGRNVNGHSYPFELIRNKTLDFFSSTLPILKADLNLPKVAKYEDFDVIDRTGEQKVWKRKDKRDVSTEPETKDGRSSKEKRRQGRGLCDKNYGIICTIMNIINGRLMSVINPIERVENPDLQPNNYNNKHSNNLIGDDPLTPCPSAAEYVTPVYAKNYQGVWRYVVQIPYEGYFTQTVEVTKCLRKKCHFMDGSCLASPRWVSLLVAELFYPHARFPSSKPGASKPLKHYHFALPFIHQTFENYAGSTYRSMNKNAKPPSNLPDLPYVPTWSERQTPAETESTGRDKRQAGSDSSASSKATYCDGVDEIGCFQVSEFG
nr:EOG090X06KU [Ilyocryptus agilis]